jgi:Pup amidohydrolase
LAKIVRNKSKVTWNGAKRTRKASSPKVLDRLIGLETEYAVYFDHASTASTAFTAELFEAFCDQVSQHLPLVPSEHADRKFLANGGAISFEPAVTSTGEVQGLIEGATPECRSPATLIAHQLAQDELFEEAIEQLPPHGSVRLLKNSADPSGHVYGLQENYEIEIAKGWRLWLLRISLCALLPIVALYWILATIWLSLIQAAGWSLSWVLPDRSVPATDSESKESTASSPSISVATQFRGRALRLAVLGLRVLHAPLVLLLTIIVRSFVLRSQLDRLAPFFATRIILDGAGHLDGNGKFWLGAKASACDRWIGLGGYWGGRPIFVFGHWLKTLCAPGSRPWRSIGRLFQSRQRIQIALGDSCMSPMSQYLRSGVTCLLLDWVEQSPADASGPRLASSFQSLKSVARDDLLIARLPDIHGKNWSALEIQQYYLGQIKEFLQQSWQVPAEAWRIVRLWQDTIDSLKAAKHDTQARQSLLGRIDWLSKLWMLQQVAQDAAWPVRKKVDLRFHELSEDGYYRKLIAVAGKYPLISPEKVRQAKRIPPSDTVASKRGYLIREFSSSGSSVTAGWDFVKMVEGDETTYYDLASDFWNSSNK